MATSQSFLRAKLCRVFSTPFPTLWATSWLEFSSPFHNIQASTTTRLVLIPTLSPRRKHEE
eukprot:12891245-Prorocentrum_lima.AAC.1